MVTQNLNWCNRDLSVAESRTETKNRLRHYPNKQNRRLAISLQVVPLKCRSGSLFSRFSPCAQPGLVPIHSSSSEKPNRPRGLQLLQSLRRLRRCRLCPPALGCSWDLFADASCPPFSLFALFPIPCLSPTNLDALPACVCRSGSYSSHFPTCVCAYSAQDSSVGGNGSGVPGRGSSLFGILSHCSPGNIDWGRFRPSCWVLGLLFSASLVGTTVVLWVIP